MRIGVGTYMRPGRRVGRGAAVALAVLVLAACSAAPGAPPAGGSLTGGGAASGGGGPNFNGSARASVTVGTTKLEYPSGQCQVGTDDSYLAVNIGSPLASAADYFGMLVGKHPAAGDTAKSAKGGGTFTGSEALVTFRKGTSAYLLNGTTLTLAPDIRSGTFTARDTLSGADVIGSFSC